MDGVSDTACFWSELCRLQVRDAACMHIINNTAPSFDSNIVDTQVTLKF
jgi:hypothetical protein